MLVIMSLKKDTHAFLTNYFFNRVLLVILYLMAGKPLETLYGKVEKVVTFVCFVCSASLLPFLTAPIHFFH